MHSRYAVIAVETSLAAVHGIVGAEVSMGRAIIEHHGDLDREALRRAIETAGFSVLRMRDERGLRVL